METAFESSHIKDRGSWRETKRRRKAEWVRLWFDPSLDFEWPDWDGSSFSLLQTVGQGKTDDGRVGG